MARRPPRAIVGLPTGVSADAVLAGDEDAAAGGIKVDPLVVALVVRRVDLVMHPEVDRQVRAQTPVVRT